MKPLDEQNLTLTPGEQECLETIQEVCPDLEIQSVEAPGWSVRGNEVLLVNDQLVFRFPTQQSGIATLRGETRLLKSIQPYLSLPIPFPVYENLGERRTGRAFASYQLIPGEPLWRELWFDLDRRVQNRLAHQAGQFLNELHHIPLEAAPSELAPQDGMHAWQETYAQVRQELFPRMRPDARQEVSEHFEAFFGQAALQRFEPCLRHGDFGPSNILCELGPGSLSGVIDFSSAGLGDPARDVAAASLYGEAFLKAMAESYPETSRLLERARFYRGIFALEEALTGVQDGDESAIRRGLSKYT